MVYLIHKYSLCDAMLEMLFCMLLSFVAKVLWGGRWQQDTGGTTGEEVEQINSHFSRLGNSTKHMLPESILYYNYVT